MRVIPPMKRSGDDIPSLLSRCQYRIFSKHGFIYRKWGCTCLAWTWFPQVGSILHQPAACGSGTCCALGTAPLCWEVLSRRWSQPDMAPRGWMRWWQWWGWPWLLIMDVLYSEFCGSCWRLEIDFAPFLVDLFRGVFPSWALCVRMIF